MGTEAVETPTIVSMSDFQRLKLESPFHLEKAMDEETMVYKKVIIDTPGGRQYKVNVPQLRFDKGSEHVMYCMDECLDLATTYAFNNNENWVHFRSILGATERQQWDALIPAAGAARTAAAFTTAKRDLLLKHFRRTSYQKFVDYIRVVRKPATMGARELANRLLTLFRYAESLPNATPLAPRERNRLFFNMFPEDQRDDCTRAKDDPYADELADLAEFFATYEKPIKNANNKRIRGGDGGDGGASSSTPSSTSSRFKRKGRKWNKPGKQSGSNKTEEDKKSSIANPCREHAYLGDRNHEWKDCIYNPNSSNYQPNLRPPKDRNGKSNGHQAKGNAYMMQIPYAYQGTGTSMPTQAGTSMHFQYGTPVKGAPPPPGVPPPPSGSYFGQYFPCPPPPPTASPHHSFFYQSRN